MVEVIGVEYMKITASLLSATRCDYSAFAAFTDLKGQCPCALVVEPPPNQTSSQMTRRCPHLDLRRAFHA